MSERQFSYVPIPTRYRGTLFRSKLEADWARAFDEKDIRWAYEPEGFNFDGIRYLIDFWLPDLRTFVEVKGTMDSAGEEKARRASLAGARHRILFIVAEPPAGEGWYEVRAGRRVDHYRGLFCYCPDCLGAQFLVTRCRHRDCAASDHPPVGAPMSAVMRWWALAFMECRRAIDAAECEREALRLAAIGA